MPHVQPYIDPVRFAWEALCHSPWPDEQITRWTGAMTSPAPEVVEARKQRKNAASRTVRRTLGRNYSDAERERRRVYAADQYQRKKAARAAATLATHPSPMPAAQVAA